MYSDLFDLHDWISAGGKLSKNDVESLESQILSEEGNIEKRVKLIAYYYGKRLYDKSTLPSLAKHVIWFVEHKPEHAVLDSPETSGDAYYDDRSIYASVKQVWERQIAANAENAVLLANAATFYTIMDKKHAIGLLERATKLDPGNKRFFESLAQAYELACRNKQDETLAKRATELRQHIADNFPDRWRDMDLANLSAAAYESGDTETAQANAEALLRMIGVQEISSDSTHAAHTVLGQIALDAGDVDTACAHLLTSGDVSSSPVLSSFGPEFVLARRLLEKGRRREVVQYLKKCSRFWESGQEILLYWLLELSLNRIPSLNKQARCELCIPDWLNRPASAILKLLS